MATLNQGLGVKAGGSGGGGGGTDTNLGNTDLQADAVRTFDVNGNDLTFENGTTNILQLDESGNSVKIGGASPYTMPTARGTSNQILGLSDSAGTAAWRTLAVTTAPSQTHAGGGTVGESTVSAGNIYLFKKDGTTMEVPSGLTTGASSVSTVGWSKYTEFRQMGSVNETIGTGTDKIIMKFVSQQLEVYRVYIIAATCNTGRTQTATPVTITLIGEIRFDGRTASAGQYVSSEFDLSDASVSPLADSIYYVGITPTTDGENLGWEGMSMYVNPKETTLSFS